MRDSEVEKQFTRSGNDLYAQLKISLEESLLGFSRDLILLDNRILKVERFDKVTPHDYVIVKKGEGMPIKGDKRGGKGNLMLKILVEFPLKLSIKEKEIVRKLLL